MVAFIAIMHVVVPLSPFEIPMLRFGLSLLTLLLKWFDLYCVWLHKLRINYSREIYGDHVLGLFLNSFWLIDFYVAHFFSDRVDEVLK